MNETIIQMFVTVLCAVIASSGFWKLLETFTGKKDAKSRMLMGLGHDRIIFLGMHYIERGYITQDEYDNLYEYLYKPYKELGGNGTAERVMQAVQRLELRRGTYTNGTDQ